MSRQMFQQFGALKTKGTYDLCYNQMESPKTEILTAMKGIHGAADKPANRRLAALEYGSECMANTNKVLDNLLGGRCNYIQLVAGGNDNLGIWAGSRIYMK